MNIKQSIGLSSLLLTSVMAHAGVSGTVFQDLPLEGTTINAYGEKDTNEQGVAGITVTASPGNETTTTAADGTWSLNTTGKVKVEFTNIPAYLAESTGQSSVQFIDGDSNSVDLALYNPADYSEGASDIAMTVQANSSLKEGNNAVALRVLSKEKIPTIDEDTAPVSNATDVAFSKLGTVWGLAYDSAHKDIYAAAVVRRHGAIGPEGLGAIYRIHGATVEKFVTVAGVGDINSSRNLSDDPTQPSHDPVFDEVGRVGLGDIDVSEDGKTLYAVNVNANTLIAIDIATKAQKVIGIPNPFGAGCPAADVKSWGIGQNKGKVYVGSVCTSNTTEGAAISQLNGESFTTIHKVPLNMDGENSLDKTQAGQSNPDGKRWRTWITTVTDLFDGNGTRKSTPAPILSDIVFDEKGGMILGFADRTAMQAGVSNYSPTTTDTNLYKYDAAGDIYRVCNVNGKYVNEGSEGCAVKDTDGHEYFTEEEWTGRHKEIALGGLSYLQGSNTVSTSVFDPAASYDTSGILWMDIGTGERLAAQRMVGEQGSPTYNGKAGGIGDLELLTPAAPTEIGNRVWFDDNSNCMQDANETGIAGVKVDLYDGAKCEGSAVKTATTDANGLYSFDVDAGKAYSVCINGAADQSPLKDTKLTCNSGGTAINNSDASLDGKDAKVAVAPLNTGANDHSFDFGFAPVAVEPAPVTPVTPVIVPDKKDVNHTDGSCDCHGYDESSAPALNGLGMIGLVFLTSFAAFLFRRELNEVAN